MTDTLTPEARSALMARIVGRNTRPELAVRRLLHAMGYRFRTNRRDLPGTPDVVLPGRRKVVFVHGCFWHGGHAGCGRARVPQANRAYWVAKIERNRRRDAAQVRALRRQGWSVAVVWECQIRDTARLARRLARFLEAPTREPGTRRAAGPRASAATGR
ncbi:MAG: very short patch repair endonuclease [Roseomonas sp.]|nr:very short patch repair endonuclease [Roseomonas sp.]